MRYYRVTQPACCVVERTVSAWRNLDRPEGGAYACRELTDTMETLIAQNALSTILTWAVWTHTCCRPNQNPHQGTAQLLLKEFLPSGHWMVSQQQPRAQMLVAAGYAAYACKTVLQLYAEH